VAWRATLLNNSSPIWFCDGFSNAASTSRSGGERKTTSESRLAVVSVRASSTAMPRERSASRSAATNAPGWSRSASSSTAVSPAAIVPATSTPARDES
jgi:hypothetical protein